MKRQNIIELCYYLAILIAINVIGYYWFTRFDLTAEKRYTLSDTTIELLETSPDIIYIEVYLEGDFPPGFIRLRNSVRELLDEFKAHSGRMLEYEFIDPFEDLDQKTYKARIEQLTEKGLIPTEVNYNEDGASSKKLIVPGAVISYGGKQLAINLLKRTMGSSPEAQLNNSIQALEYELTNTIRKLQTKTKPTIAFLEGHGELSGYELNDIVGSLQEYYDVKRARIEGKLGSLEGASMLVVAKPDSAFSKQDKFIIDQFIMQGGKVLWLVDGIAADMDSLRKGRPFLNSPLQLNLEDQLFKYGAKLKQQLVLDMKCGMINVIDNTAPPIDGRPQFMLRPWPFFPVIFNQTNHSIVQYLDPIQMDFASTIDTAGAPDIKKTILLQTSNNSKIMRPPTTIGLGVAYQGIDTRQYSKPPQTVALLLEGQFTSLFKNRFPPKLDSAFKTMDKSVETKMIVVSDGDLIRNYVRERNGETVPMPMEFDLHSGRNTRLGNRNFLMNAINYLMDDSGMFKLRSREVKLRLMDKIKSSEKRTYWQILNTVSPIIIILLFGLILNFIKRRKYAR